MGRRAGEEAETGPGLTEGAGEWEGIQRLGEANVWAGREQTASSPLPHPLEGGRGRLAGDGAG